MNEANGLDPQYERYYGKYRGKVLENVDPLLLGRIQAEVAAVSGMVLNWCMPCVPYAGDGVGFYAIPPIGANVWIEFEGGDPNYPIWSGCFWAEDEVPWGTSEPPNPQVKVFKTAFCTLVMNDTPEVGGIKIECHPEAVDVPLSMVFDSLGITITAPPAIIKMITEEGISLIYPPDLIEMTEDTIEITVPPASVTLTSEAIAVEAPVVDVTAEGAVAIEAGGDVNVEAVAVTVEAAAIPLTGAVVIDGGLVVNGAVVIDGGLLVDGMPPVLIPA
jgi:hypothetical protein